jgi:hypothetical protein
LVPRGGAEIEEENNMIAKVREISQTIDLRLSDIDLNTKITIMVSDRRVYELGIER